MKKTFVKTVVTTTEVVAVPIDGTDEFVIVYTNNIEDQTINQFIMKTSDFENSETAADIKSYKFKMTHQMKQNKYHSYYFIVTKQWMDEYKKEGRVPNIKSRYLTFGAPLASDEFIIGYSPADSTFCYFEGSYINHPIMDSYLSRDYDIYSILENEKNNPMLIFGGSNSWSSGIYNVPGNGPTLTLGFNLSDDLFERYILSGSWYEKTTFLKNNTILGKYERPDDYHENEVDY